MSNGLKRAFGALLTGLALDTVLGFLIIPGVGLRSANQQLAHYSIVVLSDLGSIPAGLEDALKRYVTGGGSVLVALGPSAAALPNVPGLY